MLGRKRSEMAPLFRAGLLFQGYLSFRAGVLRPFFKIIPAACLAAPSKRLRQWSNFQISVEYTERLMLSPKTQYNLKNAQQYFEEHLCAGDYYSEGQRIRGQWFGKGAEALGLRGDVGRD